MWKKKYSYMNDSAFLESIDTQHLQNYYIKITLLNWEENPIGEIQGKATGGSININGNSSVRRTCTLSMVIDDIKNAAISDANNLISIGKKIFLEVGISNKTNKYKEEYPIVWFPQGLFVFTQCSLSSGINNGITLSAQLEDKMCLLNGKCGGILPATIQFDKWDTINAEGKTITEKVSIAQIIREAVNHWGKEQLGRILIADIDEEIKTVMRWDDNNEILLVYGRKTSSSTEDTYFYTTDQSYRNRASCTILRAFNYGEDIGFTYDKFVYPGDLIANPGDNICTAVLDKIKTLLGNYEYFYDVYGNFIFQQIKDYTNTTQATVTINNLKKEDYKIDISNGKSVYDFTDSKLVTSFNNTPQYSRIKNDFVIWGERTAANDFKYPIRYHLAIDKKPEIGQIFNICFYQDEQDGLRKVKIPKFYEHRTDFPQEGNLDDIYYAQDQDICYKWIPTKGYILLSGRNVKFVNGLPVKPSANEANYLFVKNENHNKFLWKTNPNSSHYKQYQESIQETINEYSDDKNEIEANINVKQKDITNIQNQLNTLELKYSGELSLLENFTKDRDNMTKKISQLTNEITELTAEIAYLNTLTPKPQAQINELTAKKNEKTAEKTAATNQKNKDIEKINEIQTQLTNANYYSKKSTYENNIAQLQNQIQTLQNQLETRTIEYNLELNEKQYDQKEWVQVYDDNVYKVKTTDWRSQIYLQDAEAASLGLETSEYYAELAAEWPKLYDLTANSYVDETTGETIYTGDFYDKVKQNPYNLDYWLDFIDSNAAIGDLNISNIGRRTLSENKTEYNCLFEAEIPDYIIIKDGNTSAMKKCLDRGQEYATISDYQYSKLVVGTNRNSCFERVKNALYDYTSYNSSISISSIPIYHLEPNTRITVISQTNDISGDYLMNSISLPLDINGTMSISAIQCNAKL